ncbi:MAG: imidazoleglycerol-phosphate dehydratase HisB [Nitrososphaerota archaeon]|nr:imidazoleglycerol-phosphate dehydratase HisB [Nitrososphaerota archaeon]MDG6966286.1 imidazoleglycerol-phosphate dehydratase HisB [Nitrososphaerota archaeon]MDG6977721.1 imidazoleglycerol-phosphate dehydratase HisB [Nitrososphaerota archaeon]
MKRRAEVKRKTKETDIEVRVTIEGTGAARARTGVGFLDHMLHSLATHSLIDVTVDAKGDLVHHVVEDVATALGRAVGQALGDRTGIRRFGDAMVPMDDALALAAVDLVKRPYSVVDLRLERVMVEDAPREDLEHFFGSLAQALEATVHVKVLEGSNDHHKFEAAVKAFALALREAASPDPRRAGSKAPPSSKGSM